MPLLIEKPLILGERPVLASIFLVVVLAVCYVVGRAIYNAFFHPLAKFPGPKLWATSRIPYALEIFRGHPHKTILQLHDEYGDIVRLAPNQLSFRHDNAWKDIKGHRKAGRGEHGKDRIVYHEQRIGLLASDREGHARQRRILAHGFSAQSMAEQQPLIKSYVDLLLQRLHERCEDGSKPLNLVSWYNWTTFDIIGDLAFGESFDCLRESEYHPWVSLIFDHMKTKAIRAVLVRWPSVFKFADTLVPRSMQRKFEDNFKLTQRKVASRLSLGTPRPDFMESMVVAGNNMTREEIEVNAILLIIAGSETTATALSGATYFLATHPQVLAKLTDEVRSSFQSEDEIDLHSVAKLRYMLAVLDETMRIYPPVPSASPRLVTPGGDTICGEFVPDGTTLDIWQWVVYHSSKNFTLPESFIPERWLGDPRFANDNKDVFQPFSFGPRNCLGKNLAYAEMRLILARVIWNFNLTLAEDSKNWLDQECYDPIGTTSEDGRAKRWDNSDKVT
ncbi:hypothetical protein DL769_010934 [Monosporascus sp. CRB-8-3]|nr:hypothetical protein DL769_010934 [Monosporascus sp. CRB-8-3]